MPKFKIIPVNFREKPFIAEGKNIFDAFNKYGLSYIDFSKFLIFDIKEDLIEYKTDERKVFCQDCKYYIKSGFWLWRKEHCASPKTLMLNCSPMGYCYSGEKK